MLFIIIIDMTVLLENTQLIKFIRNHMRNSNGVFSISSLVPSKKNKSSAIEKISSHKIHGMHKAQTQ